MKARGFTLIEVLVALAIVTLGMSAVLGAMTSSADTAFYLRNKTFAQWVALNQIVETRLNPQLPATGKTTGEVEFAERKWTWTQDVEPLQQVKGMWRIEVSVRPAEIPESQKNSWYATESGIVGDALDRQPGFQVDWDVGDAPINLNLKDGSNPPDDGHQ